LEKEENLVGFIPAQMSTKTGFKIKTTFADFPRE
jgi:hypothetical protein